MRTFTVEEVEEQKGKVYRIREDGFIIRKQTLYSLGLIIVVLLTVTGLLTVIEAIMRSLGMWG